MCDNKFISDIFNVIKTIINFDNKLYKKAIKKRYDQFYKRIEIFFKLTIEY